MNLHINRFLYYWPLFLITLLVSVGLAYLYVRAQNPSYEIKATLLIQDEKKSPDQQSALKELNLSNSTKIIENEIEILKSNALISRVVDDLDLAVIYTMDDKLRKEDLYNTTPVKFTLLQANKNFEPEELNITIKDQNTFLLSTSEDSEQEYSFDKTFRNKFGTWRLSPNSNIDQFAGAPIHIKVNNPQQTAILYQKKIDVSLLNKLSTAVVISIIEQHPQRGIDVLNQLILSYNEAAKTQKNEETKSTINFIDQRLTALSEELTEAEKGIEGFKSSRGITDISADSKISLENMQANDKTLNEVNVKISVIEGIEDYINANQNTGRVPATLGIVDPALSSLIEKLTQLQLQHDRLLATTPETNPDFEPIKMQIQSTRSAIRDNVRNIKTSLYSTRNKLQSYNSQFESSIKNIPTQERQYISIKRQQASKENLYTYLLQKKEEVSVSYATTLSDEQIIDKAYAVPTGGLMKLATYAGAFILGLGLPAGLVFARSHVKDSIVNLNEIKGDLKVPIVGQLELSEDKQQLAISQSNSSAMSEQLRALRSRLHHLYKRKISGRITLVTSSISGEGKSFVSSNLAVALAMAGRKTLIIEADMRKPKIAATLGLPKGEAGLSDFLMGNATDNNIIIPHHTIPNLHVICSGTPVGNPSELLEDDSLQNLFSGLRETFDDIIIDSPPVHLVSDSFTLSKISDVTLYIIRQGYTEKAELSFIKDLYEQQQLSNMMFIFNGISKIKYGYGYNYDYSYYNQGAKKKPLNFLFSNFSNRFMPA
ncbi:capsular exopolysaccharide synthesis family protein [Pedobacter sp. CAN_A7]|uniref:GumC family protein n=1 Tax=Pedobacter sp. CAN_A7 TaxID=2787722 RepID=UPI0018C8F54A